MAVAAVLVSAPAEEAEVVAAVEAAAAVEEEEAEVAVLALVSDPQR